MFQNEAHRRRRSPVASEEFDAVFGAAVRDQSPYGARDGAIIALVCGTGLRNLDVVALQVEHVDLAASQLS